MYFVFKLRGVNCTDTGVGTLHFGSDSWARNYNIKHKDYRVFLNLPTKFKSKHFTENIALQSTIKKLPFGQ